MTLPSQDPSSRHSRLSRLSIMAGIPGQPNQPEQEWKVIPPTLDALQSLAERLLSFQFPLSRNRRYMERFVSRYLDQPQTTKRQVFNWSLPTLERFTRAIWMGVTPPLADDFEVDQWLSLQWLNCDLAQWNPLQWALEDIEHLGRFDEMGLPGVLFQKNSPKLLNPNHLATILRANGFSIPAIDTSEGGHSEQPTTLADNTLAVQYISSRTLSHPFPWSSFFRSLSQTGNVSQANFSQNFFQLLQSFSQVSQQQVSHPSLASGLSPVKLLILVEGATEALLIPHCAKVLGITAFQSVQIEVSGGKNAIESLYQSYAPRLSIPMAVVLDADAVEQYQSLISTQRPGDLIAVIPENQFNREIEDTYSGTLILKALNQVYQLDTVLSEDDYQRWSQHLLNEDWQALYEGSLTTVRRSQFLQDLFRTLGLGTFDKRLFAEQLRSVIQTPDDVPEPIRVLLEKLPLEKLP
ncbi:MAG: hypothetical protein K2X01_00060 [Cyanobacteria bacterium]|nr:hypothetical protein [Cyanobacteriota bacterium]